MFDSYQKVVQRISDTSESYDEWLSQAREFDKVSGLEDWKNTEESSLYDHEEIRIRLKTLKDLKKKGDDHGVLFTLNEGIHGNMGGMGNAKLYTKAISGTKNLVVEYISEIAEALQHIDELDHSIISFEEKVDFFNRASHCFGRTALMLSGGGQLGHFHMGVLKALIENDVLPNVISGASAGSIFTALVGTLSLEELKHYFEPEHLMVEVELEHGLLSRLFNKRGSIKEEKLRESIERGIPDLTFQEAYEKTGKYINISIAPFDAHQKSRLLNAIASPNVLIRSAVMASCAIPGVFPPVTLWAKDQDGKKVPYLPTRKWVDGSMTNDLPAKRLSRMFGVNHYIVSLTNPFIVPFVNETMHRNEWLKAVRKFGTAMVKETTQLNYTIAKPLFKYLPKLAVAANSINSIVQQNYRGDINITADFSVVKPTNLLSSLTYEEIEGLISKGEKKAWPHVERIRQTTKIGRVLDKILLKYERQELELASVGLSHLNPRQVKT